MHSPESGHFCQLLAGKLAWCLAVSDPIPESIMHSLRLKMLISNEIGIVKKKTDIGTWPVEKLFLIGWKMWQKVFFVFS